MGEVFETNRLVRHGHTDPAGIVFYPRYFEMINEVVEDFFREALGRPFGDWHRRKKTGVPTVHIDSSFLAPSYCDDVLTFSLRISKLGASSATFLITARCGDEQRLKVALTLAHVDLTVMKAIAFGDELRSDLSSFLIDDSQERS
jgi:4-hydroxybenzoyl-CoA thioesterase